MKNNGISRRGKWRIGLYITTIILVLGIFSIIQSVKVNKYEREVTAMRQMALISLEEYLTNISTNLEKTIYVSTPTMLSELSSDLWREAASAKNSLSVLPTDELHLNNTYKFLSQIGEFVMSLQRKSASGEDLTTEERQKLKDLYTYCYSLNQQVSDMCRLLQSNNLSFEDMNSTLLNDNTELKTLSKGLDDAEQSMTDLPSLIYDGPFSDHIEQTDPKFIKNEEEISKEEALEIAQKICQNEELSYAHDEDGTIPCYIFQSDKCTVAITKAGGKPVYMINSGFAGEIKIKYETAIKYAKDFISKLGYEDMRESYYFTDDGICTINFAATQNGYVLYPDLIKVSVNLENGQIMSFDASGYISNHTQREIKNPKISDSDAIAQLNNELTVIGTQLCVIPTEWMTEKYCYEIHCKTNNGQEILVYIDCNTGEEDNILILLYSDGGVLTK